jgi:hypothetical protein
VGWYAARSTLLASGILANASTLLVSLQHHLILKLGFASVTGGAEQHRIFNRAFATQRRWYYVIYLYCWIRPTLGIFTRVIATLTNGSLNCRCELPALLHPLWASSFCVVQCFTPSGIDQIGPARLIGLIAVSLRSTLRRQISLTCCVLKTRKSG